MLRRGSFVSSDSVETASKPRNESARIAAPEKMNPRFGAVAEERRRPRLDLDVAGQLDDRQHREDGDEDDLRDDEDEVHARQQTDADDVQAGHQQRGDDDPHLLVRAREVVLHVQPDDEEVDHRQEDVVEQQAPADHEAERPAERLRGVRVGRAGGRVGDDHSRVAVGGQQHRDRRDQIGGREVPLGRHRDDAVRRPDGQRHHVGEAEEDERGETEDALELARLDRAVAGALVGGGGHLGGLQLGGGHGQERAERAPRREVVKRLGGLVERPAAGDERVEVELALHVEVDEPGMSRCGSTEP